MTSSNYDTKKHIQLTATAISQIDKTPMQLITTAINSSVSNERRDQNNMACKQHIQETKQWFQAGHYHWQKSEHLEQKKKTIPGMYEYATNALVFSATLVSRFILRWVPRSCGLDGEPPLSTKRGEQLMSIELHAVLYPPALFSSPPARVVRQHHT